MFKFTNWLLLMIILSSLFIYSSCNKDDNEIRTREMEMAELDKKLKELELSGKDIDTTNLSVFYFVMKPGEGPLPQTGDECFVSYVGFLPDGTKIEDSYEIFPQNGIWEFKYKPTHKVIGLVNAIGYLNKGAEIEMFITSDLAYGSKGSKNVPPYTTVIYRAVMHDIIPAN